MTVSGTDCRLNANDIADTVPTAVKDAMPAKTRRSTCCAESAKARGIEGSATSTMDARKEAIVGLRICFAWPRIGIICAARCRHAPNTTPHPNPAIPMTG